MSTSPSVTSSPKPTNDLWLETQRRKPLDEFATKRAKRGHPGILSKRLDIDCFDDRIRQRLQALRQLSYERREDTKMCPSCIQGHESRCRKENCPCLCNDPQIPNL